ncbi:hypothetical protein MKEN_01083700 [Mycena kentingensis (nom. inval.)]|nr:hypothetical protein MKEN_01083700 [Mycena kentingensis (nom. inval.)]
MLDLQTALSSLNIDTLSVQITIFNSFSVAGVLSLTLVVAAAYCSPVIKRSELWYRHMISWVVYSATFLLLLGRQLGPPPPIGLCMVQASLIYAAPTLPTLSALCFVIDLYISLSSVVHRKRQIRPSMTKFLHRMPWTVYLAVFFEAMLTIRDPSLVARGVDHLYCHITSNIPTIASAAIVCLTGVIIIPLEIWITITVCKNWAKFRKMSTAAQNPLLSLSMFIRVGLYTFVSFLGVGLSSVSFAGSKLQPGDVLYWRLVLPIVPVLAALIFGTQKDMIQAYVFWRERVPDAGVEIEDSKISTESTQAV